MARCIAVAASVLLAQPPDLILQTEEDRLATTEAREWLKQNGGSGWSIPRSFAYASANTMFFSTGTAKRRSLAQSPPKSPKKTFCGMRDLARCRQSFKRFSLGAWGSLGEIAFK